MKRPTILGALNEKTGEAKPFPGVKLAGSGSRFLNCPACGERLDKTDLADVLFHEKTCTGQQNSPPAGEG